MSSLKLFTSNSMRGVLAQLGPEFERERGCKLEIAYDPAKIMMRRIAAGESADVAILGQAAIDGLAAQGKIDGDSRRTLARCGVGVGVKAGAPRPQIASTEDLKRALRAAKTVAFTEEGASGMHFARVIEQLGIADEVKAKARTRPGGLIGELVASGEAELAIQQIPELMAVPGVELVAPLPQDVQSLSIVTAGIFADSDQREDAQALLQFLGSPASARVFRAKGLEPA